MPTPPEASAWPAPTATSAALTQAQTCPGVININIHYMLQLNGTGNFNETDDGTPYKAWNDPVTSVPADTARNGYAWAQAVVTEMNVQAATNPLNGQPAGTANPPKGFSFALNGVYFHRVSADEFRIRKDTGEGIYTPAIFDNYGVNKASEINLFITGNYEDANSSAFDIGGLASSLGYDPSYPSSYWAKGFNTHLMYEWRQVHNGDNTALPNITFTQDTYRLVANMLSHEIGHLLGLEHTFGGANGCADAAVANRGDGWNNVMDYTGCTGTALTTCQLGVVNDNLYRPAAPANSYYNYLAASYCDEVPPRAFFVVAPLPTMAKVVMDSRGTFMADNTTVRVYAYNYKSRPGIGPLLATFENQSGRGGVWNLATRLTFYAQQRYYLELTARRASGQTHTRGQVILVGGGR